MAFFETIGVPDRAVLYFVQSFENPLLTEFFRIITFFGNPGLWFVLAAVIYWSGRENKGFHFLNVALFSIVVAGTLKTIIARPRPSAVGFKELAGDYYSSHSFPSGHATVTAAYFSYLRKRLENTQKALFVLLAVGVMLSRVYLGAHFLSDVIAGAIIGLAIGLAAEFFERELREHNFKLSKLRSKMFFIAAILLALAAMVFVSEASVLGAFFGFYAGFFLSKELGLKAKKTNRKKMLAKQAIGLTGLAALAFPQLSGGTTTGALGIFLPMFLSGFWVSFLLPWLYENIFNKQ